MDKLSVSIDWLEFTVLNTPLSRALNIIDLPFEEFTALSKGRFGYNHQLKWKDGSIFVMFSAEDEEVTEDTKINEKKGVHIMITGRGCREFSFHHEVLDLVRLLSAFENVNFSRIDLAIDDFTSKIINYDHIHEAAIRGEFTSRWSKWDEINSRQTSNGEFLGRTMYFGSQASELFCRIYDKTLERKANSEEEEEIPKSWTRLEIVYRKERANKLVKHLVNNRVPLGHALRGTLAQYLRFLIPSQDSNKARWKTAVWWEKLLAGVAKLKLTEKKEARSIEDMASWLDKQIAPTLATVLEAQQGDMSWLRKIILKGSTRLSQRHRDAISQYQKGLAYE